MNLYGWSKHLFDLAVIERARTGGRMPPQWAGLKFFNVFGPNEYHKGEMMSLVAKRFEDAKAGKPVRLFKSHRDGIADGEQRRDFIYVDDAVAVMLWLARTSARQRHLQCRHRGGIELQGHDHGAVRGAGPRAEHRIRRHAASPSATATSISREARVDHLRQAGYSAPVHADRGGGEDLRRPAYLDAPDRYR